MTTEGHGVGRGVYEDYQPPSMGVIERALEAAERGYAGGGEIVLTENLAARVVQSWWRVWQTRSAFKKEKKAHLFALRMVVKWKRSLLSERNALWTYLCSTHPKQSVAATYLECEGEESRALLQAMTEREVLQFVGLFLTYISSFLKLLGLFLDIDYVLLTRQTASLGRRSGVRRR